MLTKNEVNALNLSPTKKDFFQIWNELLDVAGKLSERWDPTSTNESDPGIVILKALAGIADKLNYNIDKNTLEAFMPTAAQEDSMRKLCEMLGYSVKYNQSAVATVTIKYYNADPADTEIEALENGLAIPKFTVITNSEQDKHYFTINHRPVLISLVQPSVSVECMEGQLVKCESSNDNDIITINQISENNRFYLPEKEIAENGIFIYNICYGASGICDDGEPWVKVDNLNTQVRGTKVYKFGFDSYEERPYIEFPEDYSALFNDGIFIYYTRTNGFDGNISSHTLTQLELPRSTGWDQVTQESFSVDNTYASTDGSNAETIKQAYNSFKKTIGTFDTLVTCRDYMNKIYNLIDYSGKPLVSNVLVTDIRNDLNRAITICSCDDSGILYKEKPLTFDPEETTVTVSSDQVVSYPTKPVFIKNAYSQNDSGAWYLGDKYGLILRDSNDFLQEDENTKNFDSTKNGEVLQEGDYWAIKQNGIKFITKFKCKSTQNNAVSAVITERKPKINHFDLVLYPFKAYKQIKSGVRNIKATYDDSFNYTNLATFNSINQQLDNLDVKTIAHNVVKPENGDIISINNYLKLNATIATTTKLTDEEGLLIIDNIKIALANAFNMHELDFGEEIPFDNIIEVIKNADTRIKLVSLNEPALYTTFSVLERFNKLGVPEIVEYAVASEWLPEDDAKLIDKFYKKNTDDGTTTSYFDTNKAKEIYNKLAVRNILAGRIPLFKYNSTFSSDFYEAPYYQAAIQINPKYDFCPLGLTRQDPSNTYNIWIDEQSNIYTRQKTGIGGLALEYLKYEAPYLSGSASNNSISNDPDSSLSSDSSTDTHATNGAVSNVIQKDADGNSITDIYSYSNILTDDVGLIENLTLKDGEFVKLRSPNFRTIKTYPAFVNYHLKLKQELTTGGEAKAADASTLFDILNTGAKKQKVIDYFKSVDKNKKTSYVKTFTISQKISKLTQAASSGEDKCEGNTVGVNAGKAHVKDIADNSCKYCGKEMFSTVQQGPITVVIKDENDAKIDAIDDLLNKSGFIKLLNKDFKATLAWAPGEGETAPKTAISKKLTIQLAFENDAASEFITDANIVAKIQSAVTSAIEQSRNNIKSEKDPTPILPTECDWTVSFSFECVPFEASSLQEWENFIRYYKSNEKISSTSLLSFKPIEENSTIFWRTYGQGYNLGKYILPSREKLRIFDRNYFSLLSNNASGSILQRVYLVKSLGSDEAPNQISNKVDYQLKDGEYLYIEYTPSTTTEDSSASTQSPKMEVLGPGTVIRPSGFASGLVDSDVLGRSGSTAYKTVTFEQNGKTETLPVHRLSSDEQIEVREFSKVELSPDTLATSSNSSKVIYIYKNFNSCPELERTTTDNSLSPRTYTLKDGEYIFYTDSLKSEFAYFGAGTEVTLEGNTTLQENSIIDIATILNSGLTEIPWQSLVLGKADKITFQEFQYVTLGAGDTIESLTLKDAQKNEDGLLYLNDSWTYCQGPIEYLLQGSDTPTVLQNVAVDTRSGNGWEACSLLELTASSDSAQTLRYEEGVIDTGLILTSVDSGGDGAKQVVLSPKELAGDKVSSALTFKTNLACDVGNTHVNVENLITNRNNIKSFQLKVFSETSPAIVETQPNKVVPTSAEIPLLDWTGETLDKKDLLDVWYQVNLDKIKVGHTKEENEKSIDYDNALALPVLITPNTYGIACFYVNYTGTVETKGRTWIEVIPGTAKDDISIINSVENIWETASARSGDSNKLYLNPGINCVRFNKSGRYFIKTSGISQGILYFDSLKLVDCEILHYKTYDGEEKKAITNGLNLKQIGYLDTSENDLSSLIDRETLLSLGNSLCADFKTEVANLVESAQKRFATNSKPFIDSLVTIDKLETDIENVLANETRYSNVLKTYKNLNETLELETDLLEELSSNTADEQLLSYLNQLASKESAQPQLSTTLEAIKALIENNVQTRSDDQNLISFIQNLNSSSDALKNAAKMAISETRDNLIKKVNADFIEELNNFVNDLSAVISSDELASIKASLDNLQETVIKEKNSTIQTLLSALSANTDLDDIYTLLDEISEANASESYSRLKSLLENLKLRINTKATQAIINDLAAAIEAEATEVAKDLAEQLRNLSGSGTIVGTIEASINTALEKVDEAISASKITTTHKTNISNALSSMRDDIQKQYASKLNTLATEIAEKLDAASTDDEVLALQDFIESLVENDNTRIIDLIEDIRASKEGYDTLKGTIKDITSNTPWADIEKAAYAGDFKAEVSAIWPKHLLKVIKQSFTGIETDIAEAITIEDPSELLKETSSNGIKTLAEITSDISTYYSKFLLIDQPLLAKESLDTLIETVKSICINEQKNSAITETVADLSKYFGVNSTFSTTEKAKFNKLTGDAKERTQPIIELLTKLANTAEPLAQTEKTQVLLELKTELNNAKALDTQFLDMIESYLYPSALEVMASFDSDSFEYRLAKKISESILIGKDDVITAGKRTALGLLTARAYLNTLNLTFTYLEDLDFNEDDLKAYWDNVSKTDVFKFENTYAFINEEEYQILESLYQDFVLVKQSILIDESKSLDSSLVEDRVAQLQELLGKFETIPDGKTTKHTVLKIMLDELLEGLEQLVQKAVYISDKDRLYDDLKKLIDKASYVADKEPIYEDLKHLVEKTADISDKNTATSLSIISLENQLLAEILETDVDRDFFYTAPIDANLAIEIGNAAYGKQTLLNPAFNYDINNINNSFVISKLDIDYLDTGIQLARSSRIRY